MIVKRAHDAKVSVEGEIGFVGYANGKSSEGTLPIEAVTFAKESNVDAMAVSVGNTHLQTNKIAKIDLDKVKEIQKGEEFKDYIESFESVILFNHFNSKN